MKIPETQVNSQGALLEGAFWALPILDFLAFSFSDPPVFFLFARLPFPLRAKGTLISEPRFSTPCEMRFFPREKGKTAFVEGFSLKRPFPLSRVGKIASRRG